MGSIYSMQPNDATSDAELITAVKAGDLRAFGIIVRRYEGAVAATIIGMMGHGDEADEAGQETMIKLYRSLGRFRGDAELKTYLTRIAINTSLDALRRRRRNLKRFFSPPPTRDGGSWEEQIASNSDHAQEFENRQLVHFALKQLKPNFRTVAVLRLMQGLSVEEVAAVLEIAPGTVLSRLSRAKRQLADILLKDSNHD